MQCGWFQKRGARLSSMSGTVTVDVFYRPCSNPLCDGRLQYDGLEDGVFNLSNQCLFLHETLLTYWDGMTSSKLSFTAHHANMEMAHRRSGSEFAALLPSRRVVRQALQSFLALLDIDYSSFGCPCCSKLRHEQLVLIMDGTTLGSRKDLVHTATTSTGASEPIPDL